MQKSLRIEVWLVTQVLNNIFTASSDGDEDHDTHMAYLGKIFSSISRVR